MPARPPLSGVQRRRLAAEAASRVELVRLARLGAPAGLRLRARGADLRAPGGRHRPGDPGRAGRARPGPYETEVASLYRAFCELRDELGREDSHGLAAAATAALRSHPDGWAGRPVLLYGFDDLTAEQLDLVRELLGGRRRHRRPSLRGPRGADRGPRRPVRPAAGRAGRLDRATSRRTPTSRAAAPCSSSSAASGRSPGDPIENDGGLALLASAGELAEAETIGSEVARLLDARSPPGEIAVVVRDPAGAGPLLRRVFSRFRIPVAVQADLPVTRTLTGAGLIALLRAAVGRGEAEDLLAYLRTPGVASPGRVDWLERRVRRDRLRTADQALEAWQRNERPPLEEIERLRKAGSGRGAAAGGRAPGALARRGRALPRGRHRRRGPRARAAGGRRDGARAGRAGRARAAQLPRRAIAAISEQRVPLWRGPTAGRVRVISPYSARARRVGHMFVASLQDGDFPRRDTGGPLLSDEARAGLELPPRRKAEVEDRYLFAMLLSRPKRAALALVAERRRRGRRRRALARSSTTSASCSPPPLPDGIEERDEALFEEAGGQGPGRLGLRRPPTPRPRRSCARSLRGPPASPASRPTPTWRSGSRASSRASPRTASAPRGLRLEPGAGADGRQGAVRPLDAREVRGVPLPLVRRARAGARADRPR